MGIYVEILILTLGLCTAQKNTCPSESANITKDAFGIPRNLQRRVWHRLPCSSFRSGEDLSGVIWYKGPNIDDPSTERLISHSRGENFTTDRRYAFGSSEFSLVIKSVEESDEGRYLCKVIPRDDVDRIGKIDVNVIGSFFPASSSDTGTTVSFQCGRRQTLPCQCAPQSPDRAISVMYWSTGEGVTTDTDIIAARFSDGAVLQFQHGADYSVGADSSLVINSLNAVHDNQRFWCHVFKLDGSLSSCYVDVKISAGRPSVYALRASAASFYLRKGMEQILPCRSWAPGLTTCGIQWLQIGTSSQFLLNYTVSDGVVVAGDAFDLAGEFGLLITSVDEVHAGNYSCAADSGRTEDIVVRVIGNTFPLDGGNATAGETLTLEADRKVTIDCPAEMNNTAMRKATVIWSFGAKDAQTTTVIGTLDLAAGSKTISDLGENSCFDISSEAALLLTKCSQNGDFRYWCHVFPYDDVLHRSYVDVVINTTQDQKLHNVLPIVGACVCLLGLVIACFTLVRCKGILNRCQHHGDQERGDYEMIEPVPEFVEKVKVFVKETLGKLPVTPWLKWDGTCYAPIDDVYTPPELFVNVPIGDGTVRYRLESEKEIFTDGIKELSSKHVIMQGKSGSGKTAILYKLAYDWSMGKANVLFGAKTLVLLFPVDVLIRAGNLGKAVVGHMLPKRTKISAESINKYCTSHPCDLVVLVDGCRGGHVKSVINIMKDQGLSKCQLVMTTSQAQQADSISKELRHVSVRGFTRDNAQHYVHKVLNVLKPQRDTLSGNAQQNPDTQETLPNTSSKETPQHVNTKPPLQNPDTEQTSTSIHINLPAELGDSVESQTGTTTHDTVNDIQPDNTSRDTGSANKETSTNLCKYLGEDILKPEVACLPANLTALCQLSVWTEQKAFKNTPTMVDVVTQLVQRMLDNSTKGSGKMKSEISFQEMLVELGKVAFFKCVESQEKSTPLSKADFVKSCKNGREIFEAGFKTGLLRHDHNDLKCYEVCFVLEIIQEYCAGMYMAHTETITEWLSKIDAQENVDKFANACVFASAELPHTCTDARRSELIKHLVSSVTEARNQSKDLKDLKLVQLCLQMNFEGKCKGSVNRDLRLLVYEGKFHLVGMSGPKMRYLSYFLRHAMLAGSKSHQAKSGHFWKRESSLKSIELFRIGRHEWSEILTDFEYFAPRVLEDFNVEKCPQVAPKSDYEEQTLKQLRERIESGDEDMPKFPDDRSDISVLHTLQSSGLQELLRSQSGKCHSSIAAQELASSLPRLETLQSLVLVGTILGPEELCILAGGLHKLTKLEKLDLRLNKQFNDDAFKAVFKSLRSCKKLTDLRLSLYRVTNSGFCEIQEEMKKDLKNSGGTLRRLKILHLLNGTPPQSFKEFLGQKISKMHSLCDFDLFGLRPLGAAASREIPAENATPKELPKPEKPASDSIESPQPAEKTKNSCGDEHPQEAASNNVKASAPATPLDSVPGVAFKPQSQRGKKQRDTNGQQETVINHTDPAPNMEDN